MTKIKIIKPPKVNVNAPNGGFWKQIGMIIIGTTISLAFTLVAAKVTDNIQRAKDRKLSAMMVMSNIEKFARNMEQHEKYLSSLDSTAAWLLNTPVEDLKLLPDNELSSLIDQTTAFIFISYDKSAESIFSNNIETWKNMGNVLFIDRVGECFSSMHQVEEYWNKWMSDASGIILDVKSHPENYEGGTMPIKIISSEKVRHMMKGIHYFRAWFTNVAATMRYQNRGNMAAIGITEQEVMDFTDAREQGDEITGESPDISQFITPPLSRDSLTTKRDLDARLEELKN